MAFILQITLPENSPAGQVVQQVAASEHLSPEQAVTRILTEVANQQGKKTPGQELLGAFSSVEDVALIDEVMEDARRLRAVDAQRRFDV